jgi:hypothetical protein
VEQLTTRFLHGKFELSYLEDIDANLSPIDILGEYPVHLHFYPSQDTILKLLIRASQIKDAQEELWQGFNHVERANGNMTYHPTELIEPYNFNMKGMH